MNCSLSEQLSNSDHKHALALEKENRRLSNLVVRIKETSFQESSSKLLDLGLDKKKLSLTIDSLREDLMKVSRENQDLEMDLRRALDENQKLKQDSKKYVDLENKYIVLVKEKKQLRIQLDGMQKQSLNLKRYSSEVYKKPEEKKAMKGAANEIKMKCKNLESSELDQEHAQLKEDFSKLYNEFHKLITSQVGYKEEMNAKNAKIIELESENTTVNQRYQVIIQTNKGLDEDKKLLMDRNEQLMDKYHKLVMQTLEDRDHYLMEERNSADKIHKLTRQKEKLEEKIMDHYRRLDNCSGKKKNAGTGIVRSTVFKIRRAGSELFNRSRRSWAEEGTPASERSHDFEYSRGHESDDERFRTPRESDFSDFGDLMYPRSRKSVDFLDNFCPSDFTFGHDSSNLEPRSRRSVDFLDFPPFNNNDCNDELDTTLHDSAIENKTGNSKDDDLFSKDKSVDLSIEGDNGANIVEDNNVEENNNECNNKESSCDKEKFDETPSRHSIWLEYGCV